MATSDVIPFLVMVLLQVGFSGMNITSKLAIESGMNPLILVAYRQLFATAAIAPFSYWIERKTMPKMNSSIMFQLFICSLTGGTGNQVLYFLGLREASATVACALCNILPALTFIVAVLFGQEYVRIKTKSGQAKVLGTVLGVGGAMFLSFYHGKVIGFGEPNIHWKFAGGNTQPNNSNRKPNSILGLFYLTGSSLSWALWFTLQARMSNIFPSPYMGSTYTCFLASIQCVIIALCSQHTSSAWSLSNTMRCIASVYSGIVCSGVAFCVMSWTIQKKGPLYTSAFTPLLLVFVAILSWLLLREQLHVGTAIGSVLIIIGLYCVLWGKSKEMNVTDTNVKETDTGEAVKNDIEELQMTSNGN